MSNPEGLWYNLTLMAQKVPLIVSWKFCLVILKGRLTALVNYFWKLSLREYWWMIWKFSVGRKRQLSDLVLNICALSETDSEISVLSFVSLFPNILGVYHGVFYLALVGWSVMWMQTSHKVLLCEYCSLSYQFGRFSRITSHFTVFCLRQGYKVDWRSAKLHNMHVTSAKSPSYHTQPYKNGVSC